MPKKAQELSALDVGRVKREGFNPVGGVPGLGLQVAGGARSWLLRFSFAGRRPEMGLGPFPEVGLAEARRAAAEARAQVRAGINPIDAAKAARSAAAASRAASKTFAECAAAFITAKSPEWANAKHAAQWTSTLDAYAYPFIGALLVQDIDTPHVLAILEPIWMTKTETAKRVRSRLENVIDWATARKLRAGLNPARWKGHLAHMLAAPSKVQMVEHHASLPYAELPAFMEHLSSCEGQGARALELAIYCASRSGEVRGATWQEFDLEARLWTIPAQRMKGSRPHRVPLSDAALKVLAAQTRGKRLDHIFTGPRGGQLSDMTLTAVLRRMKVDAVPHGFRSTFKTWASERTNFPRELIEISLAHALENAVEAAYMRGDMFDKRARLMQAWADFCGRAPAASKVIPMKNRAAR